MTGCGPVLSVHPLYTQESLAGDLPLEGTWSENDPDSRQLWQVRKAGDGYDVACIDTAKTPEMQNFRVHLLRLNQYRFLDIAPASAPDLAISGHLFAKVWMEGGELRVALLNSDWLKQMIETGRAPQAAIGEDRQILLTAPTSRLQQFVLLYAAEPEAYESDVAALHPVR
jgi:hypothetical protein